MPFITSVKDSSYVQANWDVIYSLLHKSFKDADFNVGFDLKRLFNGIISDISEVGNTLKHIFCYEDAEIIGGVFSVGKVRSGYDSACEIGWVFTSPDLSTQHRINTFNELLVNAHRLSKELGFSTVITEMGTKQGETLLIKKYGYKKIKS